MSILVLASASCVTCAGEFLQRCSLINELAATCFSLFRNATTGPPFSFAVITRSIYCTYFQHRKLISLCRSQIDFTNLEANAPPQSSLNPWHSASVNLAYQVFPDCMLQSKSMTAHLYFMIAALYNFYNLYFNCLFSYNIISSLSPIEQLIKLIIY